MTYLQELDELICGVVSKLENRPLTDENVGDLWVQFSVGGIEIIRRWQQMPDVYETLVKLLMDNDRRVLVLSMLYLGLLRNQFGDVSAAVKRIDDIAKHNTEKIIGTATGVANAMLGDPSAIAWAQAQMRKSGVSATKDFYYVVRMGIFKSFAEGWK